MYALCISFLYFCIEILDLNYPFNWRPKICEPFKMKLIRGLQSWTLSRRAIPNQDPIGNLYGIVISIKLGFTFDHAGTNNVMTHVLVWSVKARWNEWFEWAILVGFGHWYCSPSLVWHTKLCYRGVVFSSIWQMA